MRFPDPIEIDDYRDAGELIDAHRGSTDPTVRALVRALQDTIDELNKQRGFG